MTKLIHKDKTILNSISTTYDILGLTLGLMFASKKRIKKGLSLELPGKSGMRTSIHMFFCCYPYQILFLDSDFKVIDLKTLQPWTLGYKPKQKAKYVIESWPGTFDNIKIGDKVILK